MSSDNDPSSSFRVYRNELIEKFRSRVVSEEVIIEYHRRLFDVIQLIVSETDPDTVLFADSRFFLRLYSPYCAIHLFYVSKKNDHNANEQLIRLFASTGMQFEIQRLDLSLLKSNISALIQDIITLNDVICFGDNKKAEKIIGQLNKLITTELRSTIFAEIMRTESRDISCSYSPFLCEPNMELSPGGMHDIKVIYTLQKNLNGAGPFISNRTEYFQKNAPIPEPDILPQLLGNDRKEFEHAVSFFRKIKFQTQLITRNSDTWLDFLLQDEIEKLRLHNPRGTKYGLMDDFHFHAQNILRIKNNSISFMNADLQNMRSASLISLPVTLSDECVIGENDLPFQLDIIMKILYQAGCENKRIGNDLRSGIYRSLEFITVTDDYETIFWFRKILQLEKGVSRILLVMNELKVLHKFIPAWNEIAGFLQKGVYHRYTLEGHTLHAIQRIEELSDHQHLIAKVFIALPHKELLYLALLFHDIAKNVSIEGHAAMGAEIACGFLEAAGYDEEEIAAIDLLIRNHDSIIDMMHNSNEIRSELIENLVRICKERYHLDCLTLMTYANLCSVNSKVMTSWKMNQLTEIYQQARSLLAVNRIHQRSAAHHSINEYHFGRANQTDVNINLAIRNEFSIQMESGILRVVFRNTDMNSTIIQINGRYSQNLRSMILGIIAINQVTVIGAKMRVEGSRTIADEYELNDVKTTAQISDEQVLSIYENLQLAAEGMMQIGFEVKKYRKQWEAVKRSVLNRKQYVKIKITESEFDTQLSLTTLDFPGMLYRTCGTLQNLGLEIQWGDVRLEHYRVICEFRLLDRLGNKVSRNYYTFIDRELSLVL